MKALSRLYAIYNHVFVKGLNRSPSLAVCCVGEGEILIEVLVL